MHRKGANPQPPPKEQRQFAPLIKLCSRPLADSLGAQSKRATAGVVSCRSSLAARACLRSRGPATLPRAAAPSQVIGCLRPALGRCLRARWEVGSGRTSILHSDLGSNSKVLVRAQAGRNSPGPKVRASLRRKGANPRPKTNASSTNPSRPRFSEACEPVRPGLVTTRPRAQARPPQSRRHLPVTVLSPRGIASLCLQMSATQRLVSGPDFANYSRFHSAPFQRQPVNRSTGPRFHSATFHRLKSSKTGNPGTVRARTFIPAASTKFPHSRCPQR